MMNYEEFTEVVKKHIKDCLSPEYKDVEAQNVKVEENSEVEKEGISIKESEKACEVFELWDLFSKYEKINLFEGILESMVEGFLASVKNIIECQGKNLYREEFIKALKREFEKQMECQRDECDRRAGVIYIGDEAIDMLYDEDADVYSGTMYDNDGEQILPYINECTMEEVLQEIFDMSMNQKEETEELEETTMVM